MDEAANKVIGASQVIFKEDGGGGGGGDYTIYHRNLNTYL